LKHVADLRNSGLSIPLHQLRYRKVTLQNKEMMARAVDTCFDDQTGDVLVVCRFTRRREGSTESLACWSRPVATTAPAIPYWASCETRCWTSPAKAFQNVKKQPVFSDVILRRATSSRGLLFRNSEESPFVQVREHALLALAIASF
jgi:hypothetical protein